MFSKWKSFFSVHKNTSRALKFTAGCLAGIMLTSATAVALMRPIPDMPDTVSGWDSSSILVSQDGLESSAPISSAEESVSEAESSKQQETTNYKEIEIKSETEVVTPGSETAKEEDALYPGHGGKPGGSGNESVADPEPPSPPESSSNAGSGSSSSSSSSAESPSSSESSSSQGSSDSTTVTQEAVYGLDVSYYQGNIDWNAVKQSGIEFVFIRVGYRGYGTGKLCLDSKFHEYIKGAKASGLKVGVYFFSQAINESEAREEAAFVLKELEGYSLDFPVAYDMENWYSDYRTYDLSKTEITNDAVAFCEVVKAAGYTPMVYYGRGNYLKFDTALLSSRYKIWFAHYTNKTDYTGHFDIWQYTCTARCPGISGDVDKNVMYVTKTQ